MNIGEDKYHELKCIWHKKNTEKEEIFGFLEIENGSLRFVDHNNKFLLLEVSVAFVEKREGFILVYSYPSIDIHDVKEKEMNNIFKMNFYTFEPKEWCL